MRGAVEVAAWAVVAAGCWLVTLSGVTASELCFAAAAGVPAGVAARATRHVLGGSWCLRPRWALLPFVVIRTTLVESPTLVRTSLRRRSGRLQSVELPDAGELTQARAALLILATSATPGSLVVHDEDGHCFLMHRFPRTDDRVREVLAGESVARR